MLTLDPDQIERELPLAARWTLEDLRERYCAFKFEVESFYTETGEACVHIIPDSPYWKEIGLGTISATGKWRVYRKAR